MNKKLLFIGIAVLAVAVVALAPLKVETNGAVAEAPTKATSQAKAAKKGPPKTRQEAIARTKERLAKLESMSDQQWLANKEKRKKARQAQRNKKKKVKQQAKNMSAEDKAALKKKFEELRNKQ